MEFVVRIYNGDDVVGETRHSLPLAPTDPITYLRERLNEAGVPSAGEFLARNDMRIPSGSGPEVLIGNAFGLTGQGEILVRIQQAPGGIPEAMLKGGVIGPGQPPAPAPPAAIPPAPAAPAPPPVQAPAAPEPPRERARTEVEPRGRAASARLSEQPGRADPPAGGDGSSTRASEELAQAALSGRTSISSPRESVRTSDQLSSPSGSSRASEASGAPLPPANPPKPPAPAPEPPTDADTIKANKARTDLLKSKTEALNAEREQIAAEQDLEKRKDALAREAIDARQVLLDRVRVTVADPTAMTAGKDMVESELGKRGFAADTATRLFAAGGGTLSADYTDFFSLNLAQRDDLLDRVGFYRGIVIDHSREEVTGRSFRDVLQRLDLRDEAAVRARLKALVEAEKASIGQAKEKEPEKPRTPGGETLLISPLGVLAVGAPPSIVSGAGQVKAPEPAPPPEPLGETAVEAKLYPTRRTQLLYLKPALSGFYETHYTYSEQIHQAQKNGVHGLSLSMTAAVGKPTFQVGGGIGYGRGRVMQSSGAEAGKTIYVTTSFSLPRVELSFEDRQPCASRDFIDAVAAALSLPREGDALIGEDPWPDLVDPAERLFAVFRLFGHFVPRRTSIGGRLFGTKVQELTGREKASDVTESTTLAVKAQVTHAVVSAEGSAEKKDIKRDQAKETQVGERQMTTLTSVGGEGQFLGDSAEWAKSLGTYRRWAVISQDELLPTIMLLPQELNLRCQVALRDYASRHTIRQLREKGAHFLFYNEYRTIAGQSAKPVYFRIRNRLEPNRVLTILNDELASGVPVALDEIAANDRAALQLWCAAGPGQIVAYACTERSEFALGAMGAPDPRQPTPTAAKPATAAQFSLVVTDLDRAPYQTWSVSPSGHLFNTGLSAGLTGQASFEPTVLDRYLLSDLWIFEELTPDQLVTALSGPTPSPSATIDPYSRRLRRSQAGETAQPGKSGLPEGEFAILARVGTDPNSVEANTDMAITIENPAAGDPAGQRAVVRTFVVGPYQSWVARRDGRIVSKLQGRDLCLTWKNGNIVVEPVDPKRGEDQVWRYDAATRRLIRRATGEVAALFTPGLSRDPLAHQPLRTQSSSESGYADFSIVTADKPAMWPVLMREWAVANTRAWLFEKHFGGKYGCKIVIANETGAELRIAEFTAVRGSIAVTLPAKIPSKSTDAAHSVGASYIYNANDDAVGFLSLAFGDAPPSVECLFGVPRSGWSKVLLSERFDVRHRDQQIDFWHFMARDGGGELTSRGVKAACTFNSRSDDIATFTLVLSGTPTA